jgi:Mn-dependent DtxR family transcriptional regulator
VLLGNAAATVELSAERRRILELADQSGPLAPSAVARALGKPWTTVQTVQRMAQDGELIREDGKYARAKSRRRCRLVVSG